MELLTVLNARSIWRIETKYLNPRGKNIDRELIEWLKEHYHFQKSPPLPIVDPEKGVVFGSGTFELETEGKKEKYYVDLTVFNDGFLANTRASTKVTDEFLFTALTLASADLHLRFSPELIQKKLYVSELEIKLSRPLRFFNPDLERFAAKITEYYPGPIRFEFASLGFWPDQSVQLWRPSNFVIEKKIGSESEDVCFSIAPLGTDDHIKLLEEFDELLIENAMTFVRDVPAT